MSDLKKIIEILSLSAQNQEWVKLILSNKRLKKSDLKSVAIKPVLIKNELQLNFIYKHDTNDITKNFPLKEAFDVIESLMLENFFQAVFFSTIADYNLLLRADNSSSLKKSKPTITETKEFVHNKIKERIIEPEGNIYLKELGITSQSGNVLPKKQKKYRQINKYIEVIDNVLKPIDFKGEFTVVDMGAGKGYLTFALYDYLKNIAKQNPNVIGVELRKELVTKCNIISDQAAFDQLNFIEGSIQSVKLPKIDVLIALHACDTATDDAIFRGIKSDAKAIICAPCCHKQIRKQIDPQDDLKLITQFGILKERQAELLTDALRALLLEANGYKTKVFEFISTEHTPKNVLIVGVKKKNFKQPNTHILEQIENIKKTHGIEFHYLEKLLQGDKKYFV